MSTKYFIRLCIWGVLFLFLSTTFLSMISAPNTIENIVGFFLLVLLFIITIKTKCLTNLNFKRKHEK